MELVFTVEQKALFQVLSLIQGICNRKTALPATNNVLFIVGDNNEIIIRATDLETSLQFVLPVKFFYSDFPSFSVNAKRLFDFVHELKGFVFFSYNGSILTLSAGDFIENPPVEPEFHLNLFTADVSLFPAFPERIENLSSLDGNFLRFALNKAASIPSPTTASSIANGILFELDSTGCSIVSTNGHALIFCKNNLVSLSESKNFVLPKKSVAELRHVLDEFCDNEEKSVEVFLGLCKGQLVFSGTSFNFFSRLITDPFPDYKSILNYQDTPKARLNLSLLQPVLRHVSFLLGGKFLPTTFSFLKSRIKLSFNNPDSGSLIESISFVPFTEFEFTVKFFSPYIATACSLFDEKEIDFFLGKHNQPIVFLNEIESTKLLYLVMPIVN